MKTRKNILTVVFLAVLFATLPQMASAALYGGWGATPNISDDPSDAGGGAKDITGIWHAFDGTYNYFRMDVAGPISASDFANVYGIYIDTNAANLTSPTLAENSAVTLVFSWGLTLFESAVATGSISEWAYERSGDSKTLEWKIKFFDGFPNAYYYLGATSMVNSTETTIKDTTDVAAVPIPSAVWLLGTGLIGLVGLKRRQSKRR